MRLLFEELLFEMKSQEFYRFVPNDRPKLQIFPQIGIKVEVGIPFLLFKTLNIFALKIWYLMEYII